jgi:multimeric flavodoxin WrbA
MEIAAIIGKDFVREVSDSTSRNKFVTIRCGQEPYRCIIDDDDFGHVLGTMKASDGIIIAAPRYGPFGVCSSRMQAVLERLMNVSYLPIHTDPAFVKPLHGKPCGLLAVSVEGRQNNLPVLHSLEQYVLALGMQVVQCGTVAVGRSYWKREREG